MNFRESVVFIVTNEYICYLKIIKNYYYMIENFRKTYTKEQVEAATIIYFNGDQLATDVWIRKYCLKDKNHYYELTPDDMHWRIASELARIEAKYPNPRSIEQIFESIEHFKRIVPQGSPMSGIGNTFQVVSLSNCFVIGNDKDSDSYGGIMKLEQDMVQLEKRRGGVGLDLSFVRPSGMPVKNSAITSTGIVPFMERFSNGTKEVAQDGRRGALMESISIVHPDSEQFIDAKMVDGKVTGANISIRLTDKFMEAAKYGIAFEQKFPVESQEPKVVQDVDAERIWKKIIHNAWKKAEPGILFWDKVISESVPDCYADLGFKTSSTNPCFPSSEYLLTEDGYYRFGDLFNSKSLNKVICDSRISYNDDGDEKPENWVIDKNKVGTITRNASKVFLTQASAEIIEIKTSKGFSVKCTPDHHIATLDGMIEAKDLAPDHKILISIPNNDGSILNELPSTIDEKLAMLSGLITGDGCFDKNRCRLHLDFWGDDKERMKHFVCETINSLYIEIGDKYNNRNRKLSRYFISEIKSSDKIRISSPWLCKLFEDYGFIYNTKHIVPEFIMNKSATNVGKYYVAGLMYSDGSVQGSKKSGYTIRLSQSNCGLLKSVQMILQSNGILTGLYKRRDVKLTKLPDSNGGMKEYQTKEQYELITIGGGIVPYREKIGFLGDKFKEEKMLVNHNFQIKENYVDSLVEVIKHYNEPVFCIKEDIGRNIIVNGISARRCGEIPLCPYDSCRLLAINLFGYVVNPFTLEAYFDWKLFKEDVITAMRYMDDIIDLEIEKIDAILAKIDSDPEDEFIKLYERHLWEKIKEKTIRGRRTGLGVTAEGDMLAALGYTYGTDAANDFSEEVHETLKLNAYRSSVTMAKERGAFPIYDAKREKENPFILRIKEANPEIYADMVKYGRRNIALLTIAPTGCSEKDSLVTAENGFFKLSELCDINKDGFHELSRNVNVLQDDSSSKASKGFNNGFAKTKRIITTSGIELESTLNHHYKVITENGKYQWKRVDELLIADMIVSRIGGYNNKTNQKLKIIKLKTQYNEWEFKEMEITQPEYLCPEFCKFLGIFFADGSVHDKGIRIHCDYNSEQIEIVKDLSKKLFNINATSYKEKTCETVYISSQLLLKYLKTNKLLKQKAHNVEIPLLIRMSSKESIENFIEGYWIGDGGNTNNTKYIDTVSKKMAQQLGVILRGLGRNVKIRTNTKRKNSFGKRPIYRVYEKGFGSIGFNKFRYIRKDYIKWLELTKKFGNELFFDEIVDIVDSEAETLDIEVPNKNMYILNSSVSHNTVSLMTQTTSGIEPVFMPVYKRRRKINPQEKDVVVDFVDEEGIAWQEYLVFHHHFKTWLKANEYDIDVVKTMTIEQVDEIIKKSPYYKATSVDVDWIKKVEMQGRIQKHVDHSISVTVNLPEEATEELVRKVYETGWIVDCKGMTVYREGSRSGVLISNTEKKPEIPQETEIHAPKRGKRLKGEIHRFQNNLERWIAVVGMKDGKPYEIFTGKFENGLSLLPTNIFDCEVVKNIIEVDEIDETGKTIKVKRKRYDIEYIDAQGEKHVHTGLNYAFNPEFWNYAKFISGVLRHRMPLVYVYELIDSLTFKEDYINTWKNGIARVIKRYITDGQKGKGKCPECGSEDMQYKEGCLICMGCGFSRCS